MNEARLTANQMGQALRGAGYRLTSERRAVMEAVLGHERHFTGGDILADVERRDPTVGRATVFRTLEVLVEMGLIDRIHQPDGGRAYVLCPRGHHHHAICSRCGLVLSLPGCPLVSELEKEARAAGFRLEGHSLEYYGTCRSCQEKGAI